MFGRKSRDFIWICFLLIWRADLTKGQCDRACRPTSCVNGFYCRSCIDGYIVSDWKCHCGGISNCKTCHNGQCTTCMDGYTLESGRCLCGGTSNCKTCHNGQCTACMDGYTLESGRCLCGGTSNCNTCHNGQCITCMDGYTLDGDQNCHCGGTWNCKTCHNVQCTTCMDGYYLSNGNCESCGNNCKTCQTHYQCSACMDGYTLESGRCLCGGTSNCKTCHNGQCTACMDSYTLESGRCLCGGTSNCKTCHNGQCTTCMDGYTLESGRCLCGGTSNCKICYNGLCTTCIEDYILNQGYCYTCQNLNPHCTSCSPQGVCLSCKYDYILNNNKCFQCDATRCSQCSRDDTCTTCDNGYQLYQSKCYTCDVDNCLECSSDNICVKCQENFYTKYGKCESCDPNCKQCWNDGKCSECNQGFYADGLQCIECPVGCETCGGANSCYSCINNYKLMQGRCLICPDVCLKCSDDNVCIECKNNDHYINQNSCVECPDKCTRCLSETDCNGCQQGYYGKNGCTEKCPPQCSGSYCKINGGCYSCDDGFHGEFCTSTCPLNCKECNQDNGHCLECKNGFYVNNGQCTKCPSNCETCTTSTHCGECVAGFYGDLCEHECTNCKPGTKCDKSNGNCLESCADGLTGENCDKKCNEGCLSCQRSSYYICDACLPDRHGYNSYYKHFLCNNNCSFNCLNATCEDRTGDCTYGCIQGFHGNKCSDKCPENCADNVCHGNGTCVKCTEKFTGAECKCPLNCNCDRYGSCNSCKPGFGNVNLNCDQASTQQEGLTIFMLAGIVGGIIVVCSAAIIVALVIWRRRRNRRSVENLSRNDPDIPNTKDLYEVFDTEGVPLDAMPDKRIKENKQTTPVLVDNINNPVPGSSNINQRVASRGQAAHVTTAAQITTANVYDEAEELYEPLLAKELNEKVTYEHLGVDEENYYNVLKTQIQLRKLQKYVASRTQDDYINEFESLPVGLIKSYDISRTEENAFKNRYQGIYPYDETLVTLISPEFSYINASFIEGYRKKNAYIASMGPTIKFMKDLTPFWWMVWQEKVGKIVMLTRLWEAEINKCDQYWPNLDSQVIYGDLTVTSLSEMIYTDYAIRSFKLQKGKETRIIQQAHYTAWPDKVTPDDVTSLVEFRQRVNSLQTSLDGPILVHGSAGIGRTGTYIAIDILTNEGVIKGSVNILFCVRKLREQRVKMVLNLVQYRFLHECLVYTLTYDCKPIESSGFHDYVKKLNRKTIGKMFQELQSTIESRSESEILAVQRNSELTDKNRTGADIPGDIDRPRLHLGRKNASSEYINALYLNSFMLPKHFIIAQTPLSSTVKDFLTLVVQEKCKLIINLDASISPADNVGQYIPSHNEEDMNVGSFSVKAVSRKQDQLCSVTQCKIQYKNKSQSEQVDVTCVQFSRWPQTSKVPPDVVEFLQFVTEMTSLIQKSDPESPVLVHCLNGAERSGLFCLVSILLEKVECCQSVSVSNSVRQIKMKRHLAVNNQEQFKFCHDFINIHLERCHAYLSLHH